jgi:hypothetical protein
MAPIAERARFLLDLRLPERLVGMVFALVFLAAAWAATFLLGRYPHRGSTPSGVPTTWSGSCCPASIW